MGFAVNYMIRININIAIVAMVASPKAKDGGEVLVGECAVREEARRLGSTAGYSKHGQHGGVARAARAT